MPNRKGLISCRVTALYPRPKGARFYGEFDKKENLENKQEDIKIVTPKNVTSLQSNTAKHTPLATPLWDVLAFKKQQHNQAAQLLTERTIGEQALAQIKKTLGIRQPQTMVMAI